MRCQKSLFFALLFLASCKARTLNESALFQNTSSIDDANIEAVLSCQKGEFLSFHLAPMPVLPEASAITYEQHLTPAFERQTPEVLAIEVCADVVTQEVSLRRMIYKTLVFTMTDTIDKKTVILPGSWEFKSDIIKAVDVFWIPQDKLVVKGLKEAVFDHSFEGFLIQTLEKTQSGFPLPFRFENLEIKGWRDSKKTEFVSVISGPMYKPGVISPLPDLQGKILVGELTLGKGAFGATCPKQTYKAGSIEIAFDVCSTRGVGGGGTAVHSVINVSIKDDSQQVPNEYRGVAFLQDDPQFLGPNVRYRSGHHGCGLFWYVKTPFAEYAYTEANADCNFDWVPQAPRCLPGEKRCHRMSVQYGATDKIMFESKDIQQEQSE